MKCENRPHVTSYTLVTTSPVLCCCGSLHGYYIPSYELVILLLYFCNGVCYNTDTRNSLHIVLWFLLSNATTYLCGLLGPPSWAWQECNLLLRLGRP